ncbi:uncharacterized protein LOC122015081 [Zingiber officinale]|uniref:uncharacterized protein LOC122015081 n=1 Tax=Zingiber officinale TaxID=94328 RepID=UPI001C4D2960|nr:uncharacterized protein LOC122015081 [Zingiber officinale]
MPSSPTAAPGTSLAGGGKRRKGRPKGSLGKKRHKRLDSIVDSPGLIPPRPGSPVEEGDGIRRSSRVRRAPIILDASPPLRRWSKKQGLHDSTRSGVGRGRRKRWGRGGDQDGRKEPQSVSASSKNAPPLLDEEKTSEEQVEDWKSRLRSRVGKRKRGSGYFRDDSMRKEKESVKQVSTESGFDSQERRSSRGKRRKVLSDDEDVIGEETRCEDESLPSNDEGDNGEKANQEDDTKTVTDSQSLINPNNEIEICLSSEAVKENTEYINVDEEVYVQQPEQRRVSPDQQPVEVRPENQETITLGEHMNGKTIKTKSIVEEASFRASVTEENQVRKHIKEGRRCGLCGGGTDGKPPKRLVQESSGSDNEAYAGSSASDDPNYDIWDGFGDEPEWLGRILGPINDRFGIPRIWVHQHCAVWSPEVYFAGLGCLKNVRAALYRGRALKCSRCGRPGATIGCRVDRCPKTYHLPCSRAEGCIFDHRKFLIACPDHRHLFQPRGTERAQQIRKIKLRKLKLDMRRRAHDACRKDLEAEEKWLENCGEDEEFLKREGRRLHRDVLRIAPVYIGGSSEDEKLFQGWESVAGLQDVINCMKEVVILPLLYPEMFSSLGLTPPRGVLLHGYPGTGKTLVVRALIGACSRGDKRIAYFARKGADCLGKYVGDAERQLRLLFQVAERSQPSIIFFDEIDGLAPCRSRHQDQTHNSVVSTLLSLLDGLKSRGSVIVIGATNRPDSVDPALRRPGRFDREIYFPLPKLKDRSAILSLHTKNWPNPASEPLLSWIANQTAGYAGADLQALCTQAAMNALKRSCAFQELLSSAEKWSGDGKLPSLPSFKVEERDWLAALAAAPPPCSRREAGMAANYVASSPLHSHLVPCLLKPLSKLVISFYVDERIWLPPALLKASESIKSIIISALELARINTSSWWSHLDSLINQQSVANMIGRMLCRYGLVVGGSGNDPSYALDDHDKDCHLVDSDILKPSDMLRKNSVELGKSHGFRALIAGLPRSGQQHLASALLHGFNGHLEIQKINLATMSQEGHGDIVRGLTQTLLKCMNGGRCMIYMPRIDLWAIETAESTETYLDTCHVSTVSEVNGAVRVASEAWNLFIEQVDSLTAPASLIIMATCEMPTHDLPLGIRKFFTNHVSLGPSLVPSQHAIPRFSVDVDGNFSLELLVSLCTAKLVENLVQNYIQLMYQYTHMDNCRNSYKTFQIPEVSESQMQCIDAKEIVPVSNEQKDTEQIATIGEASLMDNQKQQNLGDDQAQPLPSTIVHGITDIKHNGCQDSVVKTVSKSVKGGSMLGITTFGYQILRYPHFAELCWVTSKLKEGPCADINGPWKHWPFNSCLVNACNMPEKLVSEGGSNIKDRELSGTVRGLIAVGLLAYHGIYTSVREVSSEVRRVLELLVEQIRTRISEGKDAFRYFRILSQVAYLEDIVNCWAYTFRSLPSEIQKGPLNINTTIPDDALVDIVSNEKPSLKNGSSMPIDPTCCESQAILIKENPTELVKVVQYDNLIKAPQLLSTSEVCFRDNPSSNLHLSSQSASAPVSESRTNGLERPFFKNHDVDHSNASQGTENSYPSLSNVCVFDSSGKEIPSCSERVTNPQNGLEKNLPTSGIITEQLGMSPDRNGSLSASLDFSCLYCCCGSCVQTLFVLVHRILFDSVNSSDRSSRVDDVHDILASCCSNILATVRRCHESPSRSINQSTSKRQPCACQNESGKMLNETSVCSYEKIGFLPVECVHLRNSSQAGTANSDMGSLAQDLKFFLKDGVLMPSDAQMSIPLHCKFEKLCLSSVVQAILIHKQQLK